MSILAVITQALVLMAIVSSVFILLRLLMPQFVTLRALGAPRLYIFAAAWGFMAALVLVGVAMGLLGRLRPLFRHQPLAVQQDGGCPDANAGRDGDPDWACHPGNRSRACACSGIPAATAAARGGDRQVLASCTGRSGQLLADFVEKLPGAASPIYYLYSVLNLAQYPVY